MPELEYILLSTSMYATSTYTELPALHPLCAQVIQ